MSRGEAKERPILGVMLWVAITLLLCLLHACGAKPTTAVQTAGNSFFPLAVGNRWLLEWEGDQRRPRTDTVLIDAASSHGGSTYYHIHCDWPGLRLGGWLHRDDSGNLSWSSKAGDPEHPFLHFDAAVGAVWPTGLSDCADSLTMHDDYAVVTTPYGRFDGVRQIGDPGHCIDFGWGVEFARGVGPVAVSWITIAGLRRCLLVEAQVKDDSVSATRPVPE